MAETKKKLNGVRLKKSDTANTKDGEIRNDATEKRLKVYHDTDGVDAAGEYEVVSTDQTQTLTKKTLTDPVLNGDVTGTAIDTDGTLAGNSTTKVPSQSAVKTYVDTSVAGKDAADEISYDGTAAGLAATDVQAAIDEVDGDLDSHLADAVDAHDASAISYNGTAAGLAATEVQAAIDEVDGDLDAHIIDTTTHGVTGDIVGTTDSQFLQNKTLLTNVFGENELGFSFDYTAATFAGTGETSVSSPRPIINLNNAALTGVTGIDGDATRNERTVLLNRTGVEVSLRNQAAGVTADTRIITGTGADLTLGIDCAALLQYSVADTRWYVVSISGKVSATNTTVTPSGNLTSTNAQAALEELQTDVDTRALDSDLTAHINDSVDAHDASTISYVNATSGLAATDAQAAIDEVDSDLDTHIADTTAHGTTGNVVGTTDAQSLTNKTIDGDLNTISNLAHGAEVDNPTSGVHGVTGSVVGTTDTQTLTNKTVDGATITNPAQLDVKKDTQANLVTYAATATNGQLVFATDTKKTFQVLDGALAEIGGGGSGGINYTQNPDFENDTAGWAEYANGIEPFPTLGGIGGDPATTFTRNTTTPLRGDADGLITKDGVNRQGEGIRCALDAFANADQAKKLTISFDYSTSANYADGDIKVFVYDITNAQLIRVNGEDLKAGSGTHYAQFQTAPDSTSYRLLLHVASTNASAYTVNVDNVTVGPTNLAFGTIVTDTIDYSTESFITGNTNITQKKATWTRVGDRMIVNINVTYSGVGAATTLTYSLPSGYQIDTSKQNVGGTGSQGTSYSGGFYDDSAVDKNVAVVPYTFDSTKFAFTVSGSSNAISGNSLGNGDRVNLWASVPIQGWSSNTQMSEDLGGREIVVRGAGNGGESITANVTDIPFTEVEDTTASWDGDSFTAPETGRYLISGTAFFNASVNTYIRGFTGGSFSTPLSSVISTNLHKFEGVITLNKGEVFSVRSNVSGTLTADSLHKIHIQKLASPQTILETATVAARYFRNTSQSIPSTTFTTIVFNNLDGDTHAAYNTSTGEYTIPASGWYDISANLSLILSTVANESILEVYVNGANKIRGTRMNNDQSNMGHVVSGKIPLDKGDIVTIRAYQDSGASASLEAGREEPNTFSIARIK